MVPVTVMAMAMAMATVVAAAVVLTPHAFFARTRTKYVPDPTPGA